MASEAQLKANDKYLKTKTDSILIRVAKGEKEILQAHAQQQGKSLNSFIKEAIDEKMERDKEKDWRITAGLFWPLSSKGMTKHHSRFTINIALIIKIQKDGYRWLIKIYTK